MVTVPPKFIEPPAGGPPAHGRSTRRAIKKAYDQPFGPPLVAGPLAVPLDVEPSGRYGDQRVYNGRIDRGALRARPARPGRRRRSRAGGEGEVVLARDCYMSGKTVLVWHGAGVFTAYFHLSRMEVKAGDPVRRGQLIGRVGSTGRSTGPHLHWGVRVDGLWVDPRSATRLDLASGELSAPAEPPEPVIPPPPTAPPLPAADGAAAPPR